MKNVLLVGLGRFGKHIAMQLSQLGHEIMAVDWNEERVGEVLPFVTNAQIGDSTNAEFLSSLGIGNYDICFVAIGGSFQNSLETTSLLKELGAKLVISRAERDVQEKFLLRNGADKVVILSVAKIVKPYYCRIAEPKTPQQEMFKIAYPLQRKMIEEAAVVEIGRAHV